MQYNVQQFDDCLSLKEDKACVIKFGTQFPN